MDTGVKRIFESMNNMNEADEIEDITEANAKFPNTPSGSPSVETMRTVSELGGDLGFGLVRELRVKTDVLQGNIILTVYLTEAVGQLRSELLDMIEADKGRIRGQKSEGYDNLLQRRDELIRDIETQFQQTFSKSSYVEAQFELETLMFDDPEDLIDEAEAKVVMEFDF